QAATARRVRRDRRDGAAAADAAISIGGVAGSRSRVERHVAGRHRRGGARPAARALRARTQRLSSGGARRSRIRPGVAAGTSYLGLSIVLNLNAWTGGASEKVQMGGGDLVTYLWALRWVPYALSHARNPFYSDFANYPAG